MPVVRARDFARFHGELFHGTGGRGKGSSRWSLRGQLSGQPRRVNCLDDAGDSRVEILFIAYLSYVRARETKMDNPRPLPLVGDSRRETGIANRNLTRSAHRHGVCQRDSHAELLHAFLRVAVTMESKYLYIHISCVSGRWVLSLLHASTRDALNFLSATPDLAQP